MLVAITSVIPTANRSQVLQRTLESIGRQEIQPAEIIVVDASDNDSTKKICCLSITGLESAIIYKKAQQKGAASQRNEGLDGNINPVVFFLDDDIILEPGCMEALWNCLQSDTRIGAVNAMITNQHYHTPGKITRFMYRLMSGKKMLSYAGKCIGPAWNLLPEDDPALPACTEVEWVNTTCTLYRMDSLPTPVFPERFKGYSLMEDLALSLTVAKKYKLYNVRNARIFHDSQPGEHKNNATALSKMELLNRHYIMTDIMGRNKFSDYCKLFIFELFGIFAGLRNKSGWRNLLPGILGKFMAAGKLVFTKNKYGQ